MTEKISLLDIENNIDSCYLPEFFYSVSCSWIILDPLMGLVSIVGKYAFPGPCLILVIMQVWCHLMYL